MNKKEMIEEMAKVIESVKLYGSDNYARKISHDSVLELAEELLKHYQPKLPENAVVLTDEELYYKGYRKVCEPAIKNGEVVGFVNGADYVPKNLFLFAISQARKGTAREILQIIEDDRIGYWDSCDCGKDETYWRNNSIQGTLNEIANQFGVEGKNEL